MIAFAEVRVGPPLVCDALTLFPLFATIDSDVDYLLSDEAIEAGDVSVREISAAGSVPELLVENKGQRRVLFLEGEELVGAKQNRVLNTTVLVAAAGTVKVPVSCVEEGRWRYTSTRFSPGGTHLPTKVRRALKSSVNQSVRRGRGHRSDQQRVWEEVAEHQARLGVHSETGALADCYSAMGSALERLRQALPYPTGATGVVAAIGPRLVSVDLFDKPATCQRVWGRLLTGLALDALEHAPTGGGVDAAVVAQWLTRLAGTAWQGVDTVGEGQEYRGETADGVLASVLAVGQTIIHGSAVSGR